MINNILFTIILILVIVNCVWGIKYAVKHEEKYLNRGLITASLGFVLCTIWLWI